MIFDAKVLLIASVSSIFVIGSVYCGGGGHHSVEYFKIQTPYHVHHEHHVEKVPEVKYIKVPVEKEVKIPEPYKVPIKIKVPYIIKQEIHTVPVHSHPVHSSEHIHHPPTKKHEHHDISKSFHASTNLAPIVVSHTPLQPKDVMVSFSHSLPKGFEMMFSKDSSPEYTHNFHSRLHTTALGFGSQEGKSLNSYEVEEPQESVHVAGKFQKKLVQAYPYPFSHGDDFTSGKASYETLYGFGPQDHAGGYDFTH